MSERLSELPRGWIWASLSQICEINPRHSRDVLRDDPQVTFIPMAAIDEDTGIIARPQVRPYHEVRRGYTHFAEGDILFAKITPCMENGKCAIAKNLVNGTGIGTTELHILRPLYGILGEFVYYYVRQKRFRERAAMNMTGTAGQLRVPSAYIENVKIPICPTKEQKRIVNKAEELVQRVRASNLRLQKVAPIMRQFRQLILAKAFRGELTDRDQKDEPGEKLLQEVVRLRRVRWEEKLKTEGKDPKTHKYVEPRIPDFNKLHDLPEGWVWTSFDALIIDARYGTSRKCTAEAKGLPVLRIPNIGRGVLNFGDLKYADLTDEEIQPLSLDPGDLLVCRTNGSLDLVGKSAVVGDLKGKFVFASYLIRLRPLLSQVLPAYLNFLLASPIGRNQIERKARTTAGQYNVNLQTLRSIAVPLPPFEEMKRVTTTIKQQLEHVEQIESTVRNAQSQVDLLEQSVLAKAFQGELVPQDPNDEPVTVLLEGIGAGRTSSSKSGKYQSLLETTSAVRITTDL